MTSAPVHGPLAGHLLTPENAALLLIDYQPAQLAGVRRMDRDLLVKNAVSAVRAVKTFDVPVVHSTVNVAAGRGQPTLPDLAGRLSTGPPPQPAGGSGHRREVTILPQPGGQPPVLRGLRTRRSTTGRLAQERLTMNGGCTHPDRIRDVTPSSWGCGDCLAQGRRDWVHLRVCRERGHVGCCDYSPGRHATARFRLAGHPVIRSYEPCEDWCRCCVGHFAFELEGARPAPSHP